jgi:hypothetical protein
MGKLILRRPLNAIDDDHFYRPFRRHQLQPELLVDCCEQGWRIGSDFLPGP